MKTQKVVITACAASLLSLTVAGCGKKEDETEVMVGESYIEVSYADGPLYEEPSKVLENDKDDALIERVKERNEKEEKKRQEKLEKEMIAEKEAKLADKEKKEQDRLAKEEKEKQEKEEKTLASKDEKEEEEKKGDIEDNTGFDLLKEARAEEAREKAIQEEEDKARAIAEAKAKKQEEKESGFFYKLGSIFVTASTKVFATITGWFTPKTYLAKEEAEKQKKVEKQAKPKEEDIALTEGKSPSYISNYAEPKSKSTTDAMKELELKREADKALKKSSTIMEEYLAESEKKTEEPSAYTPAEKVVEKKPQPAYITVPEPQPKKTNDEQPKVPSVKEKKEKPKVKAEPLTTDEFIEKVVAKLNKFETDFSLTADFTNINQILDDATNQADNRLMISSINYGKVKEDDTTSYTMKVEYNTTKEQYTELKSFAKKEAKSIKKKSKTNEEILSAVNQTLIDMGSYDDKRSNIYSPFTLYKYSYGVCQAYTAMGKIMLDTLGYNNGIAVGTLDGVPHTWNVLEVDGEMKHIDFTLNDNETDTLKYFLVSEEEITESRKMTAIYLD